jgi:syntaxin-binding protein 1
VPRPAVATDVACVDCARADNKQQTRDVLLNDTDELWSRNRLMHIADLGKQINVDYKKFISDHPEAAKLAKKSDGKAKELKEMIAGLQNIPKFQATSALYSQHMAITGQLMTKYNQCGLEQIATLEQNMATGEDSAGKAFKAALPELKSLLQNSDLPLSPVDKMRLLMIYVITQVCRDTRGLSDRHLLCRERALPRARADAAVLMPPCRCC